MINSSISFNIFDHIGGDAIDMPGLNEGGCTALAGIGSFTVESNEFFQHHKMAIETGGGQPSCGSSGYSKGPGANTVWRNNYAHDEYPYVYWQSFGYSLPMNGTINMGVYNNTALLNQSACFGGHVGQGFEIAFNTGYIVGNVQSSIQNNGCSQQQGWYPYLGDLGDYNPLQNDLTTNPPLATYANNYSCGPNATGTIHGVEGQPVPAQSYAAPDIFVNTCGAGHNDQPQSIVTPVWVTPANQTFSGTATENLAVVSNLSVAVVNFFIDSSTTPIATQYLQDYNQAFSASNPQWLYHAAFSTAGLSGGAHTLRAEVRDVTGIPRGPSLTYSTSGIVSASQTFTVSGSTGSTCTITTNSLPNGTVGTAYPNTALAQTGCGTGTWSITTGSLNSGLILNASTGAITGTPTAAGTNNFTVAYSTAVQSQALSITVNPATSGSCHSGSLNSTNGLYSDVLNCSPLNNWWTFTDTVGGSTVNIANGGPLTISLPSGTPHDGYTNGDGATLLTQNLVGNADFTATATFTSTPNAAYESEGIQAIVDSNNFVRCELLYTGSAIDGYSSYVGREQREHLCRECYLGHGSLCHSIRSYR